LGEHIVSHDIKDSRTSSKSGNTQGVSVVELSKTDKASQKKLNDGIKEIRSIIKKQANDTVTSKLLSLIEKLISATNQGSKISSSELKTLLNSIVKNQFKGGQGSQTKATSTASGALKIDTTSIIKLLTDNTNSITSAVIKALESKGISIDDASIKQFHNTMTSTVKDIIPAKLYSIIGELNSTLDGVVKSNQVVVQAFKSMKKLRASGGELGVSEVIPFMRNLEKGFVEVKSLVSKVNGLSSSISAIPKELKGAMDGIKDELSKMKKRTQNRTYSVIKEVSDSPASATQAVVKQVAKELSKVGEKASDPQIKKLITKIDKFSGSLDDFPKFIDALDNFAKAVTNAKSLDPKTIQNILAPLQQVSKFAPKGLKDDVLSSKPYKLLMSQMNKLIEVTKQITIKFNVKTNNLDKQIDKVITKKERSVDITLKSKNSDTVVKELEDISKPREVIITPVIATKKVVQSSVTPSRANSNKNVPQNVLQANKRQLACKEKSNIYSPDEVKQWSNTLNSKVDVLIGSLTKAANSRGAAINDADFVLPPVVESSIIKLIAIIDGISSRRENPSELRKYMDNLSANSRYTPCISTQSKRDIKEVYDVLHSVTTDAFSDIVKASEEVVKNFEKLKKFPDPVTNVTKDTKLSVAKTTEPVKSIQQTKPVKSTEPSKPSKPIKTTKTTKSTESNKDAIDSTAKRNLAQTNGSVIPRKPGANENRGIPSSTQQDIYQYTERNIDPGTTTFTSGADIGVGEKTKQIVLDHVADLSKSLLDLQQYIVTTLDEEFTKVRDKSNKKNWKIVGKTDTNPISDYFKLTEGYNRKKSGKQYSFKIANIKALQGKTGSDLEDPTSLINKFKEDVSKELLNANKFNLAESVGKWLKRFSTSDISNWKGLGTDTSRRLVGIKTKHDLGKGTSPSKGMVKALKGLGNDRLINIFEKTISEIESDRRLSEEKFKRSPLLRTIAIPAARLTSTGATTFDTASGSKRVIPKFATYKTGFENIFESLQKTKSLDIDKSYASKIRKLGIRPSGSNFEEANKLSKSMLIDLSSVKDVVDPDGKKSVNADDVRADLAKKLEASVVIKAGKLAKAKHVNSPEDILSKIDTSIYTEFANGTKTMEEFIAATSAAGVAAYDLVKGMESVEFKNIYQIIKKLLEGSADTSTPLRTLGNNPVYSKNIRDFDSTIGKLIGTIPIAEAARPRRSTHQEKIINLMSMSTPIYREKGAIGLQGTEAEGQKQFLRDLNLNLAEFVSNTKILTTAGMGKDRLPSDVKTFSSLGIPDGQAGTILEYRKDFRHEDSKYLAPLNATNVKLYSDSLAELSPAGAQFTQLGRNTANVNNALAYRSGGVGTDFPSLRSNRESELIAGGRYGTQGYGFNVTAELRNTPNTFEDQIVVSGKLADVLTSITKTIMQPDKLGRLALIGSDGQIADTPEGSVSDIVPQQLVSVIEQANRVFQDVLGIKQEYKGRAEDALIKEVTSVLTTVRGKDVQVQSAKLAEVFFNYYGRKFTTRYGSKGVSITAQGGKEELTGKQLNDLFANKKVKVLNREERATAGLGTAALPKSMGQLVQEIYKEYAQELELSKSDLKLSSQALVNSGNKFMLSMFSDASYGVVSDELDLTEQNSLFEETKKALAKLDLDLAKDIKGIEGLKEFYSNMSGAQLYTEKPIDIRISSHGIAKRGLQGENIEAIMNNVINSGEEEHTSLVTKFSPTAYRHLLGTSTDTSGKFPSLNELSKALGFESQAKGKDRATVVEDMMKLLKSRHIKGSSEELTTQANKLADLEINSNFYSSIRDEFGESRKSLVGSKFVELIEEPHANPAWSETDIKKQVAGQRLNIPAFGAYATVFGEQSKFIKQLTSDVPLEAKKHWEYLKALQVLNTDSSDMVDSLMASAQVVDVSDLRSFTKSTGKFIPASQMVNIDSMSEEEAGRVMNNSILDTAKYPGPMNLQIPNTKDPSKRESFYVPGALARVTYPEPNIAGERGLDVVARRLQSIVNAANKVDSVKGKTGEDGSTKRWDTIARIKAKLNDYRSRVTEIVGPDPQTKNLSSNEVGQLEGILQKLLKVLDQAPADNRMLYSNQKYLSGSTRGEVVRDIYKTRGADQSQAKVYQTTINSAVDQLIGPDGAPNPKMPQFAQRYEPDANLLGAKDALGVTSLSNFALSLDVKPASGEDKLKDALKSLERAKIEYYNTLAKSVLGKTGSVQEFLFNRKLPAVMGKAINATVDKTKDLETFSKELLSISNSSGDIGVDLSSLSEAASTIDEIKISHAKNVEKSKAKGLPVLQQHEIGIPENYAAKLPTSFVKRYDINEGRVKELPKPIFEKSNLAKMLTYREEVKAAMPSTAPDMQTKMKAYLSSELSPYIESLRFPVTGVSSIQPYEAKLLKPNEDGTRQMAKHSLMVPGVPDFDTSKFDTIKVKVEAVIEGLVEDREAEYNKDTPDLSRVDKLTTTISSLDKALFDVLPKYTAAQQNLDFDGDQIQLHAAKKSLARQEITQHFKTITDYDSQKDTTAQALRSDFTYDALIPSTGNYTLAEQQLAFEKKFPSEEGFGFMTKPFLTKDLEYLKPAEQLDILSNYPGTEGAEVTPLTVLDNLLPELFRNAKQMSKIMETLEAVVPGVDDEGKSTYSKDLLTALSNMKSPDGKTNGTQVDVFKEGIKNKLYDTKMTNAINANFFKLNTGQDTEALNRQLKLFERNLGYGGGLIRQGAKYNPTENLAQRFPLDLKSMGNIIGEELHTMVNEFVRFGEQKGLDVKHAGSLPVATEMAQLISQGSSGVKKLIDKINTKGGSYGELADFKDANYKVLNHRLGAMSTEDLYTDATKIASGRGEPTAKLDSSSRDQLKEYIISSIGFEGFLYELSNQVIEGAQEGLKAAISTWSESKKQKEFKGMNEDNYVKSIIRKQLKGGGVNISGTAENPLMPLYKMRTSSASGYGQRKLHMDKYGDPEVPELDGIFEGDEAKAYVSKLKEAKAVAKNIQDALTDFSANKLGNRRGSYNMLLASDIDNIYNDQRIIQELVKSLEGKEDTIESSVADRLSGNSPMSNLAIEALSKPNNTVRKEFLEIKGRAVSVPSIGQESAAISNEEYITTASMLAERDLPMPVQGDTTNKEYAAILIEHEKAVDKLKDKYLADALVIAQTDTILKAAMSRAEEIGFVTRLLPEDARSYNDRRQRVTQAAQESANNANQSTNTNSNLGVDILQRSMPAGGAGTPEGSLVKFSGGPAVDVRIVAVAEGVGIFLGKTAGIAQTTEEQQPRFSISSELEEKIKKAENIVKDITGGLNNAKGDSFANKYRASGLKGGYGNRQISEIKKQMQGFQANEDILDSTSLLGTGIHAKLEGGYQSKGYATEKPVRYDSPEGEISGTVDAIKYENGKAKHIVDIKTTSALNYEDLHRGVARFQEKTGKKTPTLEEIKPYVGKALSSTKLDDVASQLNLYLRATNTNAKASAHFYSREDPDLEPIKLDQFFDADRLKADVTAIGQARKEIKREGGTFAPTASYEEAKIIAKETKPVTPERIEELISIATEYYNSVKQGQHTQKNMPASGGLRDNELYTIGIRAREYQSQSKAFDDMVRATPVVEGKETYNVHQNLTTLHERARITQQKRGVETSGPQFNKFNEEVQSKITEASKKGPAGAEFSALITHLKDTSQIDGSKINAAWKAYRVAVGDYFVKEMAEARRQLTNDSANDDNIVPRFGEYSKVVKNFQRFVKQGIGKKTDIYTANSQYFNPESARGAGVYMDTDDLIKKSSKPLGEDTKLISLFKRITSLEENEVPIPRDAIRDVLEDLMDMDHALISLYTDAELVAKIGPKIKNGWRFDRLKGGLSKMRAALELQLNQPVKELYDEDQIAYLKQVLKELKSLETVYIDLDLDTDSFENTLGEYKFPTLIPVPKQLPRNQQLASHYKNVEGLKSHYRTPEAQGGAKTGDSFVYPIKTYGPSGKLMDNQRFVISKWGETINSAGDSIPVLKSRLDDLNKSLVDGNRTFSVAIERVVKWGAAATLVYGGMSYIKDAVNHMADVETAMARLRMVMNPLTTDFDALQKSALGFAQQYGVETTDVLGSMKVFAQQGLSQGEVQDRTQTSTLAANVTTLSATDATEALTASMKVFRSEGENSMRFLDSWSQVEARAAITAGDLADAIKKSASAGKNAGFTFDELNGMIAAIGSVTRKSGKEIGTSLRFIFRRISADKAPKALKNVGVSTTTDKGELRSGFAVLGDLASEWDNLAQAQKLSIAQAIGGTRQYNQVLVLMDNWDQVVKSLGDSLDAKGSAERRNLQLMKTYTKQLEQTKAVFSALKIEVGKVVLPSFKVAMSGIRGLIEVVNNVPESIKLAGAGIVLFVGYITKGASALNYIINMVDRTKLSFAALKDDFAKGLGQGLFESFGKGSPELDSNLFGLSSLGDSGTRNINDMTSSMGKLAFGVLAAGQAFNKFSGIVVKDTGGASKVVAKYLKTAGKLVSAVGTGALLAPIPGPVDDIIGGATEFAGEALKGTAGTFDFLGDTMGKGAQAWIENFASSNSSAVKSVMPLMATLGGLAAMAPIVSTAFKNLTQTAKDYKDEQLNRLEVDAKEIDSIQGLITSYKDLQSQKQRIAKLSTPEEQAKNIKQGDYKSPVFEEIDSLKTTRKFNASLSGLDSNMVDGFDEFGRVIINNKGNLKEYLEELKRAKTISLALSKIKITSRFTEDLTKTDGNQEWKYQVQQLAKEFPLIGDMLAKGISVGPKKALEVLQTELTQLLDAKAENPMSTAFDQDIKTALTAHSKILKTFASEYSEISKTLSGISISGTTLSDVTNLFNSGDALATFDLQAAYEDKYNIASVKGTVSGKDIAASKILSTQAGGNSSYVEASRLLTENNLFSAGRLPRAPDATGNISVENNDFVTLNKDFAKAHNIATEQAILIIDKNNHTFLQYIDSISGAPKTKKISKWDLARAARGFFPAEAILRKTKADITKLNTFISGASAGLIGISDKGLKKRQFSLGEKFFDQVSTDTLLQSNKGFDITNRTFGEPKYKENQSKDFIKKYYDPLQEYNSLKSRLGGEESTPKDGDRLGSTAKRFKELQDILKNNSVAFQYKAAIEDLSKTLYAGERAIRKNIEAEKSRQTIDKETSGFLQGKTKGISSLNLGVRDYKDLNPQQKASVKFKSYDSVAKSILVQETNLEGLLNNYKELANTYADVKEIKLVSKAFGAVMQPKRHTELLSAMDKVGGDKGTAQLYLKMSELKSPLDDININTAKTVDLLDKDSAKVTKAKNIVNLNLEEANKKKLRGERLNTFKTEFSPGVVIIKNLDMLLTKRDSAAKVGDKATVKMLDSYLTKSYGKLIKTFGVANTVKLAKELYYKDETRSRTSRVLSLGLHGLGTDPTRLTQVIESKKLSDAASVGNKLTKLFSKDHPWKSYIDKRFTNYTPKKTSEAMNLESTYSKKAKSPWFAPKTFEKALLVGNIVTAFKGASLKEKRDTVLDNIVKLQKRKSALSTNDETTKSRIDEEITTNKSLLKRDLDPKIYLNNILKSTARAAFVAYEGADTFKVSATNKENLAVTAGGIFMLMKGLEGKIGKENMPEYFKKFSKKVGPAFTEAATSGDFSKVTSLGSDTKSFLGEFTGSMKEQFKEFKDGSKSSGTVKDDRSDSEKLRELSKLKKSEQALADLKKQLSAGNTGALRSIEAALYAFGGVATLGWKASKGETAAKIKDDKKLAEAQSKAMLEYTIKNASEVDNYILNNEKSKKEKKSNIAAKPAGKPDDIIMDTNKNFIDIVETLKASGGSYLEVIKKLQDVLGNDKSFANLIVDVTRIQSSLENFRGELIKTFSTFDDKRILAPIRSLNGKLTGFGGDIQLPVSEREMSPQQRFYAGGSKELQSIFTLMSKAAMVQETNLRAIGSVRSEISTITQNLSKSTESGASEKDIVYWEEELLRLNAILNKLKQDTGKLNEQTQTLSTTMRAANKYANAIYKLNDALEDITVDHIVSGLTGLKTYFKSFNKLMGGSDSLAVQPITPEQQRMGTKVGVPLEFNISTNKDIEKAQLRTELKNASDTKSKAAAQRKINDLEEKYRRLELEQSQKEENSRLTSNMRPYTDFYKEITRLQVSGGLNDKQISDIEEVKVIINKAIGGATKPIPIEDAIKRLKTNEDSMGNTQFKMAMNELLKFKETGTEFVYQGVADSNELQDAINRLRIAYEDELKTIAADNGETTISTALRDEVADPIVGVINLSNKLLEELVTEFVGQTATDMVLKEFEKKQVVPSYLKAVSSSKELSTSPKSKVFRNSFTTPADELKPLPSVIDTDFNKVFNDKKFLAQSPVERTEYNNRGATPNMFEKIEGFINPNKTIKTYEKPSIMENVYIPSSTQDNIETNEMANGILISKSQDISTMSGNPQKIITDQETKDILKEIAVNSKAVDKEQPKEALKKAIGGRIFGEGGPREDKVPAYLSPGEFVIRAASAQQIGYQNLDVMNKKGRVPLKFKDGGLTPELIGKAHTYFTDPDAEAPIPTFDSKNEEKFNSKLTKKYLDLYRSLLPEEARENESIKLASTFRGFYNTLIDLNEAEVFSDDELFAVDASMMLNKFKEMQSNKGILGFMQRSLSKKTGATAGARALTGLDKVDLLKEINTYADGGKAISTITGKPIPTAEEKEVGMSKMREALGFVASVAHPYTSIPTSIYGMYQGFKESGFNMKSMVEGAGILEIMNFIPQAKKLGKVGKFLSKGVGKYVDNAGDINDYFNITGKLTKAPETYKVTKPIHRDFGPLSASFKDGGSVLSEEKQNEHDALYSRFPSNTESNYNSKSTVNLNKVRSFIGDSTGVAEVDASLFNKRLNTSIGSRRSVARLLKDSYMAPDKNNEVMNTDVLKLTAKSNSKLMNNKVRNFIGDSTGAVEVDDTLFNRRLNSSDDLQSVADLLKNNYNKIDTNNEKLNTDVLKLTEEPTKPLNIKNLHAKYPKSNSRLLANNKEATTSYHIPMGDGSSEISTNDWPPSQNLLDLIRNNWSSSAKVNNKEATTSYYTPTSTGYSQVSKEYWPFMNNKEQIEKFNAGGQPKSSSTEQEKYNTGTINSLLKDDEKTKGLVDEDQNHIKKWGATTAKKVGDIFTTEAQNSADFRGLDAMSRKQDFERALTEQGHGRSSVYEILKNNSYISRELQRSYLHTPDKQRGLNILRDKNSGVTGGRVAIESYRTPDESYRPKGKDSIKTTVHDPSALYPGNETTRYRKYKRDIDIRGKQLTNKMATLDSESDSYSKLAKEYKQVQKNSKAAATILEVLGEGGNIYDDARLQHRVKDFLPASETWGVGKNAFKFQPSPEKRYTSDLEDVKNAALNARQYLEESVGGAKVSSIKTLMPLSKKLANKGTVLQDYAMQGASKSEADKIIDEFSLEEIKKFLDSGDHSSVSRDTLRKLKQSINAQEYNVGGVATRSMPVKHFGGVITQTGPVFAEKGEYIIPKGYKDGTSGVGALPSMPVAKSLTSSSTVLDLTALLSDLTNIRLKVDPSALNGISLPVKDTVLEVDKTPIPIDSSSLDGVVLNVDQTPITLNSSSLNDLTLSVDKTPIPIDSSSLDGVVLEVDKTSIPIDSSSLDGVVLEVDKTPIFVDSSSLDGVVLNVDQTPIIIDTSGLLEKLASLTLSVDKTPLPIDSGSLSEFKLNIGDAPEKLAAAINNSLNAAVVNIKVDSSEVGGSVGAEKFNQLAQTVSDVNDKLLNSSVIIEDRITLLEGGIDVVIDNSVERKLASKLVGINEDVATAIRGVASLTNNVTTQIDSIRRESTNVKYLAHLALNARGTGNIT